MLVVQPKLGSLFNSVALGLCSGIVVTGVSAIPYLSIAVKWAVINCQKRLLQAAPNRMAESSVSISSQPNHRKEYLRFKATSSHPKFKHISETFSAVQTEAGRANPASWTIPVSAHWSRMQIRNALPRPRRRIRWARKYLKER